MGKSRSTYHHGDLRAALIQAADQIILESGIEQFSLRAAAKLAEVTPGAPAHHFGSARGLLTEVAILAFERLGSYLERATRSDEPAEEIRAVVLAFVKFALDFPGHYRLMLRKDLVDRTEVRYKLSADKHAKRVMQAIAAYRGKQDLNLHDADDATDLLSALSQMHGLANLVLDDKANHFFGDKDSRTFVTQTLPEVLLRMYPSSAAGSKGECAEGGTSSAAQPASGGRAKKLDESPGETQEVSPGASTQRKKRRQVPRPS